MSSHEPVTVIGLGVMGQALAGALLAVGHPTTVWNRTAAKGDALVEAGAVRAASVADAVAASPLVVLCTLDYPTVRGTLEPAVGQLRGRTVVNLTNGSPAQADEMAAWVTGHGAEYVDGGIMAVPPTIATDEAFLLYSGPERVFAAHRETLEVFGEARYVGAEIGLASLYDLALLDGMGFLFDGFHHSVAMALSHEGAGAEEFTGLLVRWLANMAKLLPALAADIDADRADGTAPQYTQGLDVQLAGQVNILRAARDAGVVDTVGLEHGKAKLEALIASGLTEWSSPVSVRQLRAGPGN
ncbi:NAD(P)-dependent oxidoreductase [Streptomyces boluensis]|uniref:NAD(P)-binding domain-containing protein n=1 Tax=Streptomyces boluensis TaxID=1775135 RepID=A0A964UVW0_9ACTN|nr:NAD(P)-binding domain-containing protein [Streptomyces boluensis]NBE56351.1 NAD(P)-binding domain-containing protein [Streptomyces boluensis]